MNSFEEIYNKDFADRGFERLSLFEELNKKYDIKKALYLGSYVHITPSLVFSDVVYVDNFKKCQKIFDSSEIKEFIEDNKKYEEETVFSYINSSYNKDLDLESDFDLLISQYAGFISTAGKKYLKKGAILVANNSHGDASMANLDEDYELIAVANHTKDKWRISEKSLDQYFIPKSRKPDDRDTLLSQMKGYTYTKTASNYIFQKK